MAPPLHYYQMVHNVFMHVLSGLFPLF